MVQAMPGERVISGDKSWQRQQPLFRYLALHPALSATSMAPQLQTAHQAHLRLLRWPCEALVNNLALAGPAKISLV